MTIDDKAERVMDFLRVNEPDDGYYLANSGGRDSTVCDDLLRRSGVKYDAHYNETTMDPPEIVQHIRRMAWGRPVEMHPPPFLTMEQTRCWYSLRYPGIVPAKPIRATIWNLIPLKKIPPSRLIRYCCQYFKEGGGPGRSVVTGVRWAESVRRKNRRSFVEKFTGKTEMFFADSDHEEPMECRNGLGSKEKIVLNPILSWSDDDVWEYIRGRGIPYCCLYNEGFKRIGCIGCPMSCNVHKEFRRWPTYRASYIKAFDWMIKMRIKMGLTCDWKTGEDVMKWWLSDRPDREREVRLLKADILGVM